ncbi:MAG: nitroreductase family protein [Christensenellales bacterium]
MNAGYDKDGRCYCDVNCAIVMNHAISAAAARSPGTCWISAFDYAAAKKLLNMPEPIAPFAFTLPGY